MNNSKRRQTFWLDQGEFLGGAERFSLDFFVQLSPTETRLLSPHVVGAQHPQYRAMLPEKVPTIDFGFPAVSGGPMAKTVAIFRLWWQARKLRGLIDKSYRPQWCTNTPRGHFLLFLAKVFWRLPGRWTAIFHDFTTRPDWLLRGITRRADVLIANSIPTRQYLRRVMLPIDHQKIRIIENGVNFGEVPDCEPPSEIQKILHIGRIDPRKGQMHTVEAADLLLERNPGLEFSLVGGSVEQDPRTTEYEKRIRDFIDKRQVPNVTLVGEVDDPFTQIAAHDALIVLPTEPETFGRIAIEGLACNKLVIAFDQTGPREIINGYQQWLIKKGLIDKNTPSPLLIEADNSMTLAETIAYFADNPKEAGIYTQHGRQFVEENYHLKETKKRLVGVLSQ